MTLGVCAQTAFAKGSLIAEYTVPTPMDLVEYSRFEIPINKPYTGAGTQSISYTFPEELTGSPALTVTLQKIAGTDNMWDSPLMTASCTTVNDWFSCNIYLKKTQTTEPQPVLDLSNLVGRISPRETPRMVPIGIDRSQVLQFLNQNAPSPEALEKQIKVLDQFLDSEPAGILSYEFDDKN